MKVKMSVLNRLSLLGLLSTAGDATMLRANRELREELGLTMEERQSSGYHALPGNKAGWLQEPPLKEFEFEGLREILLEEVKTKLRAQEEKKTLELDYLSLYEVLIEKKEELKLVKDG